MHGRLDAESKTHVIRVERLRDSLIIGSPQSIEASVTLEDLSSGETKPFEGRVEFVEEAYVHNFYVDDDLTLGSRYRIAVEGPDGETMSAEVTMPDANPEVLVRDTLRYCRGRNGRRARPVRFEVRSRDNVAAVLVNYYAFDPEEDTFRWYRYGHRGDATETEDGLRVRVNTNQDLLNLSSQQSPFSFDPPPPAVPVLAEVVAVASGDEWPGEAYRLTSLEGISQPGRFSNVENGLGLVFGTASDTTRLPVVYSEPLASCSEL
jgi:hypothetical protein